MADGHPIWVHCVLLILVTSVAPPLVSSSFVRLLCFFYYVFLLFPLLLNLSSHYMPLRQRDVRESLQSRSNLERRKF
ncbi:hypothetical protein CDEST_09868 [Colletotrichum destructivum]|uniref:Secreted peptide n=1 Tax=Colletotrichum destructivum TaxID=34406 RepID=A0AAX4IN94_9PEZI|nr:hypothetical protein CDEST_09868 [Colletotrichum destructivum]